MKIVQMGKEVVFCRLCGQLAGLPTRCPVSYNGQHEFVVRPAGIYICQYCGATIGEGTICKASYNGTHAFVKMDKA